MPVFEYSIYRARICKRLGSPGIDYKESILPAHLAGGPVRLPCLSYGPARLHWLAESIPPGNDSWAPKMFTNSDSEQQTITLLSNLLLCRVGKRERWSWWYFFPISSLYSLTIHLGILQFLCASTVVFSFVFDGMDIGSFSRSVRSKLGRIRHASVFIHDLITVPGRYRTFFFSSYTVLFWRILKRYSVFTWDCTSAQFILP